MGGPESLDPVQFCRMQVDTLRTAVDALTVEVRRLSGAIDALHETRTDDAEEAALRVIGRLATSAHGKPYWEAGADHIGKRWYDAGMRKVGVAVVMLLAGALLSAALIWYGAHTANGAKP